jgi:hypothetical protein
MLVREAPVDDLELHGLGLAFMPEEQHVLEL